MSKGDFFLKKKHTKKNSLNELEKRNLSSSQEITLDNMKSLICYAWKQEVGSVSNTIR